MILRSIRVQNYEKIPSNPPLVKGGRGGFGMRIGIRCGDNRDQLITCRRQPPVGMMRLCKISDVHGQDGDNGHADGSTSEGIA